MVYCILFSSFAISDLTLTRGRPACTHGFIVSCFVHTHVYARIHTYTPRHIHSYTHTHIHTYTHAYTHKVFIIVCLINQRSCMVYCVRFLSLAISDLAFMRGRPAFMRGFILSCFACSFETSTHSQTHTHAHAHTHTHKRIHALCIMLTY